ncbi:hypothetical protein [Flavobacterium terrisoli]|uniref:hypothetical protein n=1 Tax=Flavobacterium terrisoli TaxID=3242195 RepID=UPI002542961D|nr:hypothetical protein [Flavobacterium buctense]
METEIWFVLVRQLKLICNTFLVLRDKAVQKSRFFLCGLFRKDLYLIDGLRQSASYMPLQNHTMKNIFIIFFFSIFQLSAQSKQFSFNESENSFIRKNSSNYNIHYIEETKTLIAFNEGSFKVFTKNKIYIFTNNFYSESYLKFEILDNKNRIIGNGLFSNKENKVTLYFDNESLSKKLGFTIVEISPKNKISE